MTNLDHPSPKIDRVLINSRFFKFVSGLPATSNKIIKMENEGHINTNKYNELIKKRARFNERSRR